MVPLKVAGSGSLPNKVSVVRVQAACAVEGVLRNVEITKNNDSTTGRNLLTSSS